MGTPSQFSSSGEPPRVERVEQIETSATPRWIPILFVIAFLFLVYLAYANMTARSAAQKTAEDASKREQAMAAEVDKTNARIADLKGEMDVTIQKLGLTQDELAHARALAPQVRKDQKQSDEQLKTQIGAVQADTATKFGQVATELSGTKSDVAATKADLEATKAKLSSTVGDLGVQSGLIARNHEEVEELKRLGERDIFGFTLNKSSKAP